MPLIKSGSKAAISKNISEMVAAGHPHDQAVAAALSNARRYAHRAKGGFTAPKAPWFERAAARGMTAHPRAAMLHSTVPGRTDKLPLSVPSGSYVIPADIVAGEGQGNSAAGADKIIKSITSGKFKAPRLPIGRMHKMPYKSKFAAGGHTPSVPIMAAGGEVIIHPDGVADIGHGDMDHGHSFLDQWVLDRRKGHIKTLRKLKGPVRD